MSDAGLLAESFVRESNNIEDEDFVFNNEEDTGQNLLDSTENCLSDIATDISSREVLLDEVQSGINLHEPKENGFNPDDIKEAEEPDHYNHCPPPNKDTPGTPRCSEDGNVEGDKWTYILGHDQLKKRILKEGNQDGFRPVKGQSVEVRCVGKLDDDTKVDEFDNLRFTIGEEDFILAFDLCVPLMFVGEICELVAESRFAYGKSGRTPDIPPDSRVTYEIELLSVEDRPAYSELPVRERIQLGDKKRERGNAMYAKGEYSRSIDEYTRALKVLEDASDGKKKIEEDSEELLVETRVKCYNNMAAAQMKIEAWDAANSSCDKVLKFQPENVKALFRKGKCLASMGDTKAALSFMREAAKYGPDSKAIHREIMSFEKKDRAENEAEKALYQKMLGVNSSPSEERRTSSSRWWKLYLAGAVVAALLSIGLIGYRYSSD